jgi:hypothetical protein
VLSAIRWKVDKVCYPANPTLTSWRDPRLLKAIGEYFCESILIPGMVKAWSEAPAAAPQKPVRRAQPAWLHATCKPEVLVRIHRTEVPALLLAAEAVREGTGMQPGPGFNILPGKGLPMAAAYLANAMAWRGGGNVAVITPSLSGTFAHDVVARVGQQPCGRHGNGPYAIRWDRSMDDEVSVRVIG